jgi:phage-related protein
MQVGFVSDYVSAPFSIISRALSLFLNILELLSVKIDEDDFLLFSVSRSIDKES